MNIYQKRVFEVTKKLALFCALIGLSFSELEEFTTDIARRYVLTLPDANLKRIVTERLNQWQGRTASEKDSR